MKNHHAAPPPELELAHAAVVALLARAQPSLLGSSHPFAWDQPDRGKHLFALLRKSPGARSVIEMAAKQHNSSNDLGKFRKLADEAPEATANVDDLLALFLAIWRLPCTEMAAQLGGATTEAFQWALYYPERGLKAFSEVGFSYSPVKDLDDGQLELLKQNSALLAAVRDARGSDPEIRLGWQAGPDCRALTAPHAQRDSVVHDAEAFWQRQQACVTDHVCQVLLYGLLGSAVDGAVRALRDALPAFIILASKERRLPNDNRVPADRLHAALAATPGMETLRAAVGVEISQKLEQAAEKARRLLPLFWPDEPLAGAPRYQPPPHTLEPPVRIGRS